MQYTVLVPDRPETFYRVVEGDDPETIHRSFMSNHEAGKRRRRRREDAADHRGISVRETLDQALSLAAFLNTVSGRPPSTHVAEFMLDPPERYAFAKTGTTDGHYTVWGEADELSGSSLVAIR